MNKFKLVLIGTGNIANFHVPALREVGFEIVGCTGTIDSKTSPDFTKKHKIANLYNGTSDLIKNSEDWDAVVIAITVENTIEVLNDFLNFKKPILVEKPISLTPEKFDSLKEIKSPVQVAYNRRFYSTIQRAKKFIEENSPCLIKMELPDQINFELSGKEQDFYSVRENSVHGIDILNYLFPDLEIVNVDSYRQPNNILGKNISLKSSSGDLCLVLMNWNSPSNFSLEIEAHPYRLELKPFEKYNLYEGMDVIHPTEDYPLRRYVPKLIETGSVFSKSKDFKPGFLEQAMEFYDIVSGQKSKISACVKDAQKACFMANQIIITS